MTVADAGGFRRAAEQLYRSQSAVSAQIRDLEAELGVALFHRTTRRVNLTAEGERLLTRTRKALAELDAGIRELGDDVALRHGRIVIGTTPTISSTRLPPIIAAIRARHPGIAVNIREDFARGTLDRVRRDEVDFALCPATEGADGQDFAFEPLMRDEFRAVLPPGDALSGRAEVRFDEIADRPILAFPRATALRRQLDALFNGRGRVLNPAFQASHHVTLLAMVAAGLGVTVLPGLCLGDGQFAGAFAGTSASTSAAWDAGWGAVSTARLVDPVLHRTVAIATRKGQALSPAAQAGVAMIRQRFAPAG
jgi:DNA-binding transcriptional LysR family regulator